MDIHSLSILIVDDMQFSREKLRQSLKKQGITDLKVASNALQALKAFDKYAPDVILVDKMMPKVDGLKLIEKIRRKTDPVDKPCHIILLTADESDGTLEEAVLSGADHYLYKDASAEKIIHCIEFIDTQCRAKKILSMAQSKTPEADSASSAVKEVKQDAMAELDLEITIKNWQPNPVNETISHIPKRATTDADKNDVLSSVAVESIDSEQYIGPHPRDFAYIIVDDEMFSAESTKHMLEKFAIHNIRIARNALEALRYHAKEPADILFVDYMMPRVNGISLTEKIRHYDQQHDLSTAIIMLSAVATLEKIEEAIEIGVDEYLYKPPSSTDLISHMETAYKKQNPDMPASHVNWLRLLSG